jgi:hypothetical protein
MKGMKNQSRIVSRTSPGRTEENHENLSQDIQSSGRDSKRAPLEWMEEALPPSKLTLLDFVVFWGLTSTVLKFRVLLPSYFKKGTCLCWSCLSRKTNSIFRCDREK